MKLKLISILTLISFYVFGINITENKIFELSKDSNPTINNIKASRLMGDKAYYKAEDNLNIKLYGGYSHETTREKPLNPFIPIFSPVNQYQLGLSKNFKYGMSSKLQASVDSRTAPGFQSMNTTILSLELGFDLWSDFMGRMTKRELENANLSFEQKKLEEKINLKVFESNARKLYWALVANAEKYKLTKKLLNTAKKQAKDARLRQRNSIADQSEVARYDSLVSMRRGSLLLLDYEKESLIKNLKKTFPNLNGKTVEISDYNLNKAAIEVLSCTKVIKSKKTAPYDFTKYDEVISYLKKVQKNQEVIDESSSIDVKLRTVFKTTGVGSDPQGTNPETYQGSFDASIDDIDENDRSGFEAALTFTIPLGEASDNLKKVNKLINKKRLTSEFNDIEANIKSTHNQISKSIHLLSSVMATQKSNAKSLNIRVKDMKKKYSQARIPLYALIQDQDELMNNDLNIIDTQLTILNTLLDYFIVFTDTPCAFNRK